MTFKMIDGRQVVAEGRIVVAWANADYSAEKPYWAFEQDVPVEGICAYDAYETPDDFVNAWYGMVENPKAMWYWVMDGGDLVLSGLCDPMDIDIFKERWDLHDTDKDLEGLFEEIEVVSALSNSERREALWHLQHYTYLDMEEAQLELVAAYEVEQYKPKVDKLLEIGWPAKRVMDKVHEWFLDYRMAEETETLLFEYLEGIDRELKGKGISVDKTLADATERCAEVHQALKSDREIEKLWEELEDVPVDEEECLDVDWQGWPKGTHREEIWHWFDERHSKGVGWLMNEYEPSREARSNGQLTMDD